jgi:hypothetical protein
MKWNNRIIKEYGLYYIAEVIYEDEIPHSWTEPLTGYYESRQGVIDSLEIMLKDSKQDTLEIEGGVIKNNEN